MPATCSDTGLVCTYPEGQAECAPDGAELLCDETFLRTTGVSEEVISTLLAGIPHTERVTAENMDAMWANRRRLFFKRAAGYGSRAAYRGDKLTKRVWQEIVVGVYVAQALVVPSERRVADAEAGPP